MEPKIDIHLLLGCQSADQAPDLSYRYLFSLFS